MLIFSLWVELLKNASLETQNPCKTDHAGIIIPHPFHIRIKIPYPFQWGAPKFDAGEAFAMMAASFVALVEENSELCLHLSALVEGVFQCVTTVHKTIRNDLEGARLDGGSNQIIFWAEDNKCEKLGYGYRMSILDELTWGVESYLVF